MKSVNREITAKYKANTVNRLMGSEGNRWFIVLTPTLSAYCCKASNLLPGLWSAGGSFQQDTNTVHDMFDFKNCQYLKIRVS